MILYLLWRLHPAKWYVDLQPRFFIIFCSTWICHVSSKHFLRTFFAFLYMYVWVSECYENEIKMMRVVWKLLIVYHDFNFWVGSSFEIEAKNLNHSIIVRMYKNFAAIRIESLKGSYISRCKSIHFANLVDLMTWFSLSSVRLHFDQKLF